MSDTIGPKRAKEIFVEAIELPPEQRAAFLDDACGGDAQLRSEVESLLAADAGAGAFLGGPTVGQRDVPAGSLNLPAAERQIGPYRLLQVIGEGGFGTVYMAEQEHPVRRRVALKIIKLGMDTRQVVARFEAERQALAMMDHPHIARVFDAGATEAGRPYFVMELVNGVPITEYCDANRLTPRQRLELFIPVCQAVQHAHQKGVIHRDIKPTNVLVTMHDGNPVPKVIDFGIAKATQARLTEKTVFTEFRQMIGTPEYMSPEQAEMSGLDIDTRSDIYSLGVLLYELLTGTTPFDARELRSKAYAEIQRVIREVDPPKPSTRLSTNRDQLPSVAASRNIEPRKLGTLVRGELDWIVMKCLEKDRTRRYETANGLAADVTRYLSNEPVSAASPTAAYRARKFVRRHKVGMTMAALAFLLLAGGLAGTSWGFLQARHERDMAIRARIEAETARRAEAEAREYEAGTDKFLVEMFESIDPVQSRGKPVLVQDILDHAVGRLEREPPAHRKAEASLRFVFGIGYRSVGQFDKAREQLQRAADMYRSEWGDGDLRTAKAFDALGYVHLQLNELDPAERALETARQINQAVRGPDHEETISCENGLAEVLIRRGKLAEADRVLGELLPRVRRLKGDDSDDTLAVMSVMSNVRRDQGRVAEAETMLRDAIELSRRRHGDDHVYTVTFQSNLADLLRSQGRVAEAEPLQRQALGAVRRLYGPDHLSTLSASNNLALSLEALGRFEEAEQIYRDVIDRRRRLLGDEHVSTLTARSNHALLLQNTGRLDEAEAAFRDIVEKISRTAAADHPNVMLWSNNLAWLLAQRGDAADAEAIYRELVPRARAAAGPRSPMTVSFTMRYGQTLAMQQRWADAEPLLAEAYAAANELGVADQQGGYAASYGVCLAKQGKASEALPVLLRADEVLRRAPRRDLQSELRVADALVLVYEQLASPEQAEAWRRRGAELRSLATQPAATGASSGPATTQPQ